MLAQISTWLLFATLGQAPAETAASWLKAVPGDVDLVVRSRGVESTSGDLTDMIKAMSPRAAETAAPALAQLLDQARGQYGDDAVKTPWVGVVRAVPPAPGGVMPFAVLMLTDDYRGVLAKVAAGKELALKPQDGGFDAFEAPHGDGSWYAVKGAGFAAFGPDRDLIAAIAKPGETSLGAILTPAAARPLLTGDLGVFVNVARLAKRYADQIAQARQAFMAALDQGAQRMPNGANMDAVKDMYGAFFDALDGAETLTLGLDFAAAGLDVAGRLDLKPGADAAKPVAVDQGGAAELGGLASDAAFYVYMNMPASSIEKLQNLSLRMVDPSGKLGPAMARAMEQFHGLGQIETLGTASFEGGMRAFNVINAADPKAYIAAVQAMLSAMKEADGPLNFYKEVKVEPDAQNHQGISFTHVVAVFDQEKLAKFAAGNGGGAAGIKTMFSGDSLSYWIGTDGKRVIQVTTPTWDQARAQIDRHLKAESTVGAVPAFQAVRSALADRANFLMILNAQGFVRMVASQLAASLNKPELKELAGVPPEPAFFGFSWTLKEPTGHEFRISLPSPVVPVFEKGMLPVFQSMQPKPQP
ncbi:hypothetical protein [Paludisphaera mucosa]|uniref:DUF3352 domain-containing protein n=1 Tax=Paludisphaera mucosa TaxID=3030827 RepID=A0ABT6FIQ3_9BACT|nr:hypothetical protein [Paludisphaera mucosa]MDG3007376.1 hypothetical protein [Paludisphaera mucosa]